MHRNELDDKEMSCMDIETPMQRMQREALEEQAAADGAAVQPEETPMQRMQREALEEQAAADGAAVQPEETPMQRMQREALEEQTAADTTNGNESSMQDMQAEAKAEQAESDAASRQATAFKLRLNHCLFDLGHRAGKVTNYAIMLLILSSVILSMIDTLASVHNVWDEQIRTIQTTILWIFLLEYALRVYAAKDRKKYMLGFYGVIDFLTVLPLLFGSSGSSIMRLARLMRIMKLTQYFPVLTTLLRSVSGATHMIFAVIATIAAVSIFAGNLAYMIEPETFNNAFIGTWWSLVTMSTVGYGDMVPHSAGGMMLGAVLILIGICVVAMMTAVIAVRVGRMVNMNNKCFGCDKSIAAEYKYCPHCGQNQSDDIDLFTDDE